MKKLTWDDWCEVFQDYSFFEPIIQEIFIKESLGNIVEHSNLTPGTNAVFKVNQFVVKLYVPIETSLWEQDEYVSELEAIQLASSLGVSTPKVICNGELQLEQNWRYIIFEYVDAEDIGPLISTFTEKELFSVIDFIKQFMSLYHIERDLSSVDLLQGLDKDFWEPFSVRFMNNLRSYITNKEFTGCLTHGDLTGENILYNGNVMVIDFADSMVTPKAYEYPPLVFDLFNYSLDAAMYLVDNDFDYLINLLVDGLLLHEYGGDMLQDILKRLHIDPIEMIDIEDVRNAIIDILK